MRLVYNRAKKPVQRIFKNPRIQLFPPRGVPSAIKRNNYESLEKLEHGNSNRLTSNATEKRDSKLILFPDFNPDFRYVIENLSKSRKIVQHFPTNREPPLPSLSLSLSVT